VQVVTEEVLSEASNLVTDGAEAKLLGERLSLGRARRSNSGLNETVLMETNEAFQLIEAVNGGGTVLT
jgi:hypothetical protein